MSAPAHEELIIKQLAGSLNAEEQQALERWLKEKPEHQKLYDDYRQVWELAEPKAALPDFRTAQEWQRLEVALGETPRQNLKKSNQSGSSWSILKVAASVAFLLAAVAVLFLLNREAAQLVKTSGAEELQLSLADGTKVWLNKGSTLRYPEEFEAGERVVQLSGEAFFEVAHNPEKPFIVLADQAKVKVLGTSFNVKAWQHAPLAEVFVLTGKVSLSAVEAAQQQVVLEPGEKGVLAKATKLVSREELENPNTLAWKNNKLVFKKATLGEVISTLEAYFEVELQVSDPELLNCRFTSSFDDPELNEVLEVLRHSLNISIKGAGKRFNLAGEGCVAKEV